MEAYKSPCYQGYNGISWSQKDLTDALRVYWADKVQMDGDDTKKKVEYVLEIVDKILEEINKNDPRFSRDTIKVGSYFQRLKVEKADEFDFSIPLAGLKDFHWATSSPAYYGFNLPYQEDPKRSFPNELTVVKTCQPLPPPPIQYTRVSLSGSEVPMWKNSDDFMREGDIIPYLVKKRFKELLDDAIRSLDLRGVVRRSKLQNGPALVLKIYFSNDKNPISVDFSPMILTHVPFRSSMNWPRPNAKWPPREKVDKIKKIGLNSVAKKNFYWCLSLVEPERELLKNIDKDGMNTCRRQSQRLMKKVRDDFWSPAISSYHLKNILFWECEKYPNSEDWDKDMLGERFISMTERLLQCIEKRELKMYFYPDVNLINEKSGGDLDIAAKKIREFMKNPKEYLLCDKTGVRIY